MALPLTALLEQNNTDKIAFSFFILNNFLRVCGDFQLLFVVLFMNKFS